MRNLILFCLSLLTGLQFAELVENNTTALHLKVEYFPLVSGGTETTHSGDTPSAHSAYLSNNTSVFHTSDETNASNYNNTAHDVNGTTLNYNFRGKNLQSDIHYVSYIPPTLFADTASITHESDLDNTTQISESKYTLSSSDYSHEDFRDIQNKSVLKDECNEEGRAKHKQSDEDNPKVNENPKLDKNYYRYVALWLAVLCLMSITGILANICLCMVFVLCGDMRTSSNLMIMNLAVSDIICIVVNTPFFIIYAFCTWAGGQFLCVLYQFTRYFLIGSSIYSVVAISLQRYFAVSFVFKSRLSECLTVGKYKPFIMLSLVWILAGALARINFLQAGIMRDTYCKERDNEYDPLSKRYDILFVIVYCVIPIFIIGTSTAATSIKLKKSAKNMPGEDPDNDTRRNRVVSSNVLLALFIVFGMSYVPYFLYFVFVNLNDTTLDFNTFCAVYMLLFINPCFNPVALFIMSRKYKKILFSFFKRRNNNA